MPVHTQKLHFIIAIAEKQSREQKRAKGKKAWTLQEEGKKLQLLNDRSKSGKGIEWIFELFDVFEAITS